SKPNCCKSVHKAMLLTEFPDLQWLKRQAEEKFASRKTMQGSVLPHAGWPSVILNASTKKCCRDHIRGPLSIFTNITGTSAVEVGKKRVVVHSDFYYVTNQDQYYTLDIKNPEGTETCNIHFGEYWADQVLATWVAKPSTLVYEPYFTVPHQRFELHNKLYFKDEGFNRLLVKAKNAVSELDEEETLYEILVRLLENDRQIIKAAEKIPSIKHATRTEILKRLILAVDYIHSYYDKDLTLGELASVSCFSKFHFLRLFKIVFNKTPYQFINEVKIQHAKSLLLHSQQDIISISRALGFRDASSFSRLFYNHTGLYPTQFRVN
ncbi:MAG: helix-turn-helix domain-containing protein, partial [Sediminibacterium sp.]